MSEDIIKPETGTVIHLLRNPAPVDIEMAKPSLPVLEKMKRVKIFPIGSGCQVSSLAESSGRVFVTIGPAETRVSVLDAEGCMRASWVAIFGWCDICEIGVTVDGTRRPFEDSELISQAMTGSVRMFGRVVDTQDFLRDASQMLQQLLDDILTRTVGSGALFDAIVLSAPTWMRDILTPSKAIRPHIFTEIEDDK